MLPSFATLVQTYFTEHLTQQRALSPRTIATYRDAFILFLDFAEAHLGKSPVVMTLADITPEVIMAFLDPISERQRHNSVRSRNARLVALRSFLKFAAHRDVTLLKVIERALGVPVKRFERPMLGFLSRDEVLAVIGTPDGTWVSQRDHVLFLLLYNSGSARLGNHRGQGWRGGARGRCRLRASSWQRPQTAQRAAVALYHQGHSRLGKTESAVGCVVTIAAKSRWACDDAVKCGKTVGVGGPSCG